jgi:hypothetical protein
MRIGLFSFTAISLASAKEFASLAKRLLIANKKTKIPENIFILLLLILILCWQHLGMTKNTKMMVTHQNFVHLSSN